MLYCRFRASGSMEVKWKTDFSGFEHALNEHIL